ncbi:hypothetical protein AVEN_95940-1 [Araneus ventricosus]|uniref:Uncharacterized protein n=1 Tax=Araneus ventricosus TaxID=182803 RepID=A0A4Y2EKN8_ARAVE|nr:hypothetical protein AVEN_95940-1 [Araneus ventricosus]
MKIRSPGHLGGRPQIEENEKKYNDFLQLLMDAAEENARQENLETAEDETDRYGSVSNNDALSSSVKHKSRVVFLNTN